MRELLQTFIFGKNCLVNVVQHSPDINDMFEYFVKQDEDGEAIGGLIRNLGMAKHRFSSSQKRLGRFCGKINANMSCAQWLRNTRPPGSKEVVSAKEFLRKIDLEPYAQMAMMADGADEIKEFLIGFHDDENVDTALSCSVVKLCMDKLYWLFFQGGCLKTGYTKFALEACKYVRVLQLGRNELQSFGNVNGVPEEIITRCMKRMQAWYVLVQAVARVDFNDFEVIGAFHVLTLHSKQRAAWMDEAFSVGQAEQKKIESYEILGRTLKVNPKGLEAQVAQHKPIALQIFLETGCTIAEAWRLAKEKTQKRHTTAQNYPITDLNPVLVGYQTFGGSGSGLEQGFSKALWAINEQQRGAGDQYIEDLMKLIFDRRPEEEAETVQIAQGLWLKHFGEARQGSQTRLDRGTAKAHKEGSESQWLRIRRTLVQEGTFAHGPSSSTANVTADSVGEYWTESHQKEADFQQTKLHKRKFEVFQRKLLPQSKETPEFVEFKEEYKVKRAKQDKKRIREEELRVVKGKGFVKVELQGLKLHQSEDHIKQEQMEKLGLEKSTRIDADIFVNEDPTKPGDRTLWAAVLRGGRIATPQFLLNEQRGGSIKYKPALESRRKLWISDGFAARHDVIAQIIRSCITSYTGCKVALIETESHFLNLKCAASRSNRPNSVLGLVTGREKRAKGDSYSTADEVLKILTSVDMPQSSLGVSGR